MPATNTDLVSVRYSYGYVSRVIERCTTKLTPAAKDILRFICDRNHAFDKEREVITQKHFLVGVPGVRAGLGISERALQYGLRELENLGIIRVYGVARDKRRYAINVEVLERDTPFVERLRQTFARNMGDQKSARVQSTAPLRVQPIAPSPARDHARAITLEYKPKILLRKSSTYSVPSALSQIFRQGQKTKGPKMKVTSGNRASNVLGVARQASASTVLAQQKRLERGKLDAVYHEYERLVRERFNIPVKPATRDQLAIFRRTFMDGLEDHDPREFMQMVVEHWTTIIMGKFHWMRQPPDHPDLLFICKFVHQFLDATLTIKRGEPLRAQTYREKRRIEREDKGIVADKKRISELEREVHALQQRERTRIVMPVQRRVVERPAKPVELPPEEGMPEL